MSDLPKSASRNDALTEDAILGNEKFLRALLPPKFHHFYDGLVATALSKAQSETKPRWIPVAERQPPCANNYLATLTYPDGEKHVQERYFSMRGTWNSDYVSHWQPLPEAAK